MTKCNFSTLEQLKEFLTQIGCDDTKFCVEPDYADAVIGLTDECKVVYDYEKMVEHLANIYAESDIEDPYEAAAEWIDYNCQIPYWEIIVSTGEEALIYDYEGGLCERFSDHIKTIIGMNNYGCLLLDSECITDDSIDEIESILKEYDVEYRIV